MKDKRTSSLDSFNDPDKAFNLVVGTVIKYFRKIDGQGSKRLNTITQEELAIRLSLSRMSIVNFENGRTHVPLNKLFLICKHLGIPITQFISKLQTKLLEDGLTCFNTLNNDTSNTVFHELLADENLEEKISNEWTNKS